MRRLLQPTLARRIFMSLLGASFLIWLLVMALNLAENMSEGRTRDELNGLHAYLMDGLAGIDDEAAARAFVLGAIGETRRDAYNWRNFRFVKFSLSGPGGRAVSSNIAPDAKRLQFMAGMVVPLELDGHRFLLTRGKTARWTLDLALPLHTAYGILRDDWLGLTIGVLLPFPIIFLAVWVAVARGLRPLRALSERIAARSSDDLSPLGVDPRYAELKPLAGALDSLLLQLRGKIGREQAFVQDAAHELRTPLAVISAQAHVLDSAAGGPERQEASQQMAQAIARSAHLIAQLLDLARLDSTPPRQTQRLDVAQLVRNDLAQRVNGAMVRGIDLSLDAPDVLAADLEPQVFRSVFHNLVDNALRYVPEGGSVVVALAASESGLTFSVADNGPGIPPDQQTLVFERFYRGGQSDARGAGLGLAIARQAAGRMHGSLQLSPGPGGRGCLFTLMLPASVVTVT